MSNVGTIKENLRRKCIMNVMIYEDNGGRVGSLEGIVSRYFIKRGIKFSMFITRLGAFCDFDSENNTDMVFIDIDGEEGDAINFARRIRQNNKNAIIFLLTDKLQIIPEMMKVGIFQVILKPIDADLVYDELDRAVQLYADIYSIYDISWCGVNHLLNYKDIFYIEAYNRHLYIVTGEDSYMSMGSIHKEKERFGGRSFARCHCGFLVNMQYITECGSNYVKMSNGKEIPISRQYRDEFMNSFTKYLKTKTIH